MNFRRRGFGRVDAVKPRRDTACGSPYVEECIVAILRCGFGSFRDIMIAGGCHDLLRCDANGRNVFEKQFEEGLVAAFVALESSVARKDDGVECLAIAAQTLAQAVEYEVERGLAGGVLDAGYFSL